MNHPNSAADPLASADGQVYFQDPAEGMEFAPPGQINCPACDAVIELNMGDGEAHDYICDACGAEFTAAPMDLYEHVPEDFQQLEAQSRAQAAQQIVIEQQKSTLEAQTREKRLAIRSRWVYILGSLATFFMLACLILNVVSYPASTWTSLPFEGNTPLKRSLVTYAYYCGMASWLFIFATITLGLGSLLALRRKGT